MQASAQTPPSRFWRRSRFRLSVRSLLILVLVVALGLHWVTHRARTQRDAVAAITEAGGKVGYDWEMSSTKDAYGTHLRNWSGYREPPGPEWLVRLLGPDYLGDVKHVFLRSGTTDLVMPHVGKLDRVESLDIYSPSVTNAGMAHVRKLPRLRELSLRHCASMTGECLVNLENLSQLRNIYIEDTPVEDRDLRNLSRLPSLECLLFSRCPIGDEGMSHLKNLVTLKYLSVSPSSEVTSAGLANLSGMNELVYLGLYDDSSRVDDLSPLRNLTRLQELYVAHAPISDDGLAPIAALPELRHLGLSGSLITDTGLRYLSNLKSLEYLDIKDTSVTDDGLVPITALPQLRRLDLSGTLITDAGLRYLNNLKSLECLDIEDTSVTDSGLVPIAALPELQNLGLSGTHITDAGLRNLNNLKSLRYLDLEDTSVTDAGVASFQKSHPKVMIHH
jgi:Leucine Rich repeat